MMTNLLGRRVVVDDDPTIDAALRDKAGYIAAVSTDRDGFWLLVEMADNGWLVSLRALDCTLSPAPLP